MAQKLTHMSLNELSQLLKGQLKSVISNHSITLNLNGNDIVNVGSLYINDDEKLYFGNDSDASIEYDEDGTDRLVISGSAGGIDITGSVYFAGSPTFVGSTTFSDDITIADDKKIYFGTDSDASIEYNEDGNDKLIISGSAAGIEVTGSMYISGSVYANEYVIDTITTTVTNIEQRGSTKFGDSSDDTHQFSGSLYVADDAKIYFGGNQDASIEYDENGTDELRFAGAAITFEQDATFDNDVTLGVATTDITTVTSRLTASQGILISDDRFLYFGTGNDASIEYDENGTDELRFAGAAVTFEQDATFDNDVTLGVAATDVTTITGRLTGSQGGYFADKVGIGTAAPDYELDVAGDIGVNEYIYHNGDADTFIRFAPDLVNLVAGGFSAIKYEKSAGKIIINNTNENVDFHVMAEDNTELLTTDAANNRVGIGTTAPEAYLDIKNIVDDGTTNRTMLRLHNYRDDDADVNDFGPISIDFDIENLGGGTKTGTARIAAVSSPVGTDHTSILGEKTSALIFSTMHEDVLAEAMRINATGSLGIGTNDPKTALSVVHDYATTTFENQIADNEGGGHIIKYGSGTLTAGKLYYLHTDAAWTATDSDAVASGGSQLLGIALGSSPTSHGVLLKGYVKIASGYVNGTAAIGQPVYVDNGTAGEYTFTAPSGTGDFVRIVGYCIDIDSSDILLYFRPDNTWVEIA